MASVGGLFYVESKGHDFCDTSITLRNELSVMVGGEDDGGT